MPPEIDADTAREIAREITRVGRDTKAAFDAAERSFAELRRADHETKQYCDAVTADLRRQLADVRAQRDKDVELFEVALRRQGLTPVDTPEGSKVFDRNAPEIKALEHYIRRGKEALEPHEVKALTVGDDTSGGYLVPPQVAAEIIRALREYNPVRQVARIATTASDKLDFPTVGEMSAYWVGEVQPRTETSTTFGSKEIELGELACYVDVTNRLLEDANVDIFQLLGTLLGEAFAYEEGKAYIAGDGVKKPRGLATYIDVADGIPVVASGNATQIDDGDVLIDVEAALKAPYAEAAVWMMNRKTLATVRKLKDGAGNYLWTAQPGLVGGRPGTILGRPYMVAPDMPDIAAGTYPILFGDFRGYCILDKLNGGFSLLRDPFTLATTGKVRFHARRRTGGDLIQAERFAAVEVSA